MKWIKVKYNLAPKLSTITWKPCCIKYCRRMVKVKTNSLYHRPKRSSNKIWILQTKFEFGKKTNLTFLVMDFLRLSLLGIYGAVWLLSSLTATCCLLDTCRVFISGFFLYVMGFSCLSLLGIYRAVQYVLSSLTATCSLLDSCWV